MDITVEKLKSDAVIPHKLYGSDSGFIVNSHEVEILYFHSGGNGERQLHGKELEMKFDTPNTFNLKYLERVLLKTGIKISCEGYAFVVSSLTERACNNGLVVLGGTVPCDYRGELKVVLLNTSRETKSVTLGEPVARVTPVKVIKCDFVEGKVGTSERVDNSLGSLEEKKSTEVIFNTRV
jgi:dUTP pyrophosphatase